MFLFESFESSPACPSPLTCYKAVSCVQSDSSVSTTGEQRSAFGRNMDKARHQYLEAYKNFLMKYEEFI